MKANLSLQILVFTLIRIVLNTLHRMVYPFLGVFSLGLGVASTTLAGAVTARSLLGVLSPLLGSSADRAGRRRALLTGVGLFTLGALLAALQPGFPAFVLALVLALFGKYLFDPAVQAYLGDRTTYQQRGRILALTELGWSFSFILGIPAMGFLIERLGWRAPFVALALLGLFSLLALRALLPDDHPGSHTGGSPSPSLRTILLQVVTSRPALAAVSVGLLISTANETVNLVSGLWMGAAFNLQIAGLSAAFVLVGLSELAGEGLAASFTDRLGKPRAVGLGILANSLAALALPYLGRSLPGALAGLFLFYFSFEFTLVSLIPLLTEVLPGARATLMSANIAGLSLGRAAGAGLGAWLYTFSPAGGSPGAILACAAAAAVLNLGALLALWRLQQSLPAAEGQLRG